MVFVDHWLDAIRGQKKGGCQSDKPFQYFYFCLVWFKEVFICTAVQIILWLFAQVHCRAAFTLSSRLPLFVYTLQLTVLYVAGGDAMLTGEDEGETNTNSLVVQ